MIHADNQLVVFFIIREMKIRLKCRFVMMFKVKINLAADGLTFCQEFGRPKNDLAYKSPCNKPNGHR